MLQHNAHCPVLPRPLVVIGKTRRQEGMTIFMYTYIYTYIHLIVYTYIYIYIDVHMSDLRTVRIVETLFLCTLCHNRNVRQIV